MAVATKSTTTQAESDIQGIGSGSLADGVIIGSYRVVRFLGRGGMGEGYEVLHTLLDKRFALKVISKELSQDEKARNLFRREGREAGNLHHPNIVRVDDCGEVDGRMYLRMELIEGRPCRGDTCVTLTDYIIACQLRVPPEEAVPILHDILRGLNYAHSCRRVHRDTLGRRHRRTGGDPHLGRHHHLHPQRSVAHDRLVRPPRHVGRVAGRRQVGAAPHLLTDGR